MKSEHAAILDDLLSRWHFARRHEPLGRGFAPRSAGFEQWRSSRQFDDQNGALDSDLDSSKLKVIDFQVSEMKEPHRTAVYVDARNLCTGVVVWSSPRLPIDRGAAEQVIREARLIICQRLVNAGVI